MERHLLVGGATHCCWGGSATHDDAASLEVNNIIGGHRGGIHVAHIIELKTLGRLSPEAKGRLELAA